MKDEEMAEEYAEEYFGKKTELVEVWKVKSCKEAFLAGLKAGRLWHKVADGDLPKEDLRPKTLGFYLTASKHKSYKGFVFEVAYFTGVIFTKGGDILDNVIAWCEIPTFDKE